MNNKYKFTLADMLGIKYEYYSPIKKKHKNKFNSHQYQCSIRAYMKISGESSKRVFKNIVNTAISKKQFNYGDNVEILIKVGKKYYSCKKLKIEEYTSVATFCSLHKKGSYIIFIEGHVFPYVDGCIYDTNSEDKPYTRCNLEYVLTEPIESVLVKR